MALTANEKFHDILLRRQVQLLLFSSGLSADAIALIDATEANVRDLLNIRLERMAEEGVDFGPETTKRLRVLQQALAEMRGAGFDKGQVLMSTTMRDLVNQEADFVDQALTLVSPVLLDTILPTATALGSLVSSEPFQGAVMRDWWSRMQAADTRRIMDAIRLGLAQGDDSRTISQRVFGLRATNGSDGVTELTRRDATAIARTAVTAMSNDARGAYFEANKDVFDEEVYIATLDSHTTPLCRSLDGNIYKVGEGPIPGKTTHWSCRSVRVALIGSELIGNRPAAAWTEDDLAGLSRAERRAKIRELTGQVPAKTTYQEWLMRQSNDFQDTVLGPTRAEAFRGGEVTLKSFVDSASGRTLTLDELRELEPQAFGE